ncbi:hypothetical protein RJ639_040843 [Escallonia herrerae]|uniref:Uncharacterized protein n=1 Tax=Escallonia herrerae TaxID=1293975 RepID=A0AA88WE39_9ASTE|nr:hypothetical protein RJ639_040842 [Escallonia herrerae]KAK3025417.1 hypothetical protein RJ639_040843 [Escallonia herrerae]
MKAKMATVTVFTIANSAGHGKILKGEFRRKCLANTINEIAEEEARRANEELLPSGSFRERNSKQGPRLLVVLHPKYRLPCSPGMLGCSLASSLLTFDSATRFCIVSADLGTAPPYFVFNPRRSTGVPPTAVGVAWTSNLASRIWKLHSTAQDGNTALSSDDRKTWDACRKALSTFEFSVEEEDKILGKAFGLVHSPYWSEERDKEMPKFEVVNDILDYLRSLNLSNDDLCKLLKKFPEVLGCNLEGELMTNVQVLEKQWGIKGKSLRNLLLRNPKVLGYNVDCKGDCMAQCTRCWVRF